ncbi:AAA family ATPase [Candidatus Woesearchaeota archaeon]|jgi:RecA-family ATPase|nr:AAA family ATPase [Candidatus Woesearchaeota archaeon]
MIEKDVWELELRDYSYFESIKPERDYLIKNFIPVKSLIMMFSPPASFKSILAQYMAICIGSGRECLGCKSKVKGVLLCDRENNDNLIADKMKKIRRGLGIRKKDVPVYYLPRNEGDLLNEEFLEKLHHAIKQNKISLVIFDTLHRYGDYQENSADDLSRLYTKCFSPLIDKQKVSILFLHHTKKQGDFRGSGDFEGMCDVVYKLDRKDKSDFFTIKNTKNRTGELEKVTAKITFFDKEIIIEKVDKNEDNQINKLNGLTEKINSYFVETDLRLKTSEIKNQLKKDKFDYSESTLKRALNKLVNKKKLEKVGERGGYMKASSDEANT